MSADQNRLLRRGRPRSRVKSLRNWWSAPGPGVIQAWADSVLRIRDVPDYAVPTQMPGTPHCLSDQGDSRPARPCI